MSTEKEAGTEDDNTSDVELEGVDLDGDEGVEDDDVGGGEDVEMDAADGEDTEQMETEDHDELEAARRERSELMAAEQRQGGTTVEEAATGRRNDDSSTSMEEKLTYLLAQSDVFAHFLAGTVAATTTKRGGGKKGGSRGKTDRMTEAEEDAQLLKSAQSKRSVIRLDKQPSILAEHCSMHNYQLEGLNWLIRLHCNGINGILADEVSRGDRSEHSCCGIRSAKCHCCFVFVEIFKSMQESSLEFLHLITLCCSLERYISSPFLSLDGSRKDPSNNLLLSVPSRRTRCQGTTYRCSSKVRCWYVRLVYGSYFTVCVASVTIAALQLESPNKNLADFGQHIRKLDERIQKVVSDHPSYPYGWDEGGTDRIRDKASSRGRGNG